jgi:hypothetical protein
MGFVYSKANVFYKNGLRYTCDCDGHGWDF